MTEHAAPPAALIPFTSLFDDKGCKARYGVAYVRSICSQAGVMMSETDPDEDAIAIDCTLNLGVGTVSLQVKCTSQFTLRGRTASWPLKDHWQQSWTQSKLPVYFVLVVVDEQDRAAWLDHRSDGTFHRAAAYWMRVNTGTAVDRISIDKNQRLTTETFHTWNTDLLACFMSPSIPIQHAG